MAKIENPYGIALEFKLLDAKSQACPLEAVRLAPSAVNKQPWRVIVNEDGAHFYLKHAKGYVSGAVDDIQKIDMGIALCHFALPAEEAGLATTFCIKDPSALVELDMEYIASYLFSAGKSNI